MDLLLQLEAPQNRLRMEHVLRLAKIHDARQLETK